MKSILLLVPIVFTLASCDKDSTAEAPKAVEVTEEVTVVVPAETAGAIEDAAEEAEEMAEEAAEAMEEAAEAADPNRPQTPGEHLDRALQKTGQGLQTAGEKTEEGIDKAAEKTGNFLKKVGEKIEEKAEEP